MKRAVIYTRVSTEEQAIEGFSLQAQKKEIIDYCNRYNFEVVKVYEDEGISGKKISNRPQLLQLLEDSYKDIFDIVIVWDISRLSRDSSDTSSIIKKLKSNNIELISATQGIDTRTDEGIFQLQLMGTLAELERKRIIKRVTSGMMQKARMGKWNGGKVLGYDSKADKTLAINEKEADVVKRIFNMFLDGTSISQIAKDLNDSDIQTKRGNKFSIQAVRDILKNPLYKGYIRFGQYKNSSKKKIKQNNDETVIYVKGEHEPIIEETIFNKVETIFKSKETGKKGNPGVYLFSSLLRCPKCGAKMNAQKVKRKNGYTIYYRCGAKVIYNECQMGSIREDKIKDKILDKIKDIFLNDKIVKDVIDNLNKRTEQDNERYFKLRKDIQKNLRKTHKDIERYKKDYINDKIEGEVFNELYKEAKKKINELEIKNKEIEHRIGKDVNKEISVELVKKVLNNYNELFKIGDDSKKKKVLSCLIDKINLTDEKTIKNIEYKIKIPINEDENSEKIESVINDSTLNRIISNGGYLLSIYIVIFIRLYFY